MRKELVNGEIFLAEDALKRGLIDEIILPDEYVRREFGDKMTLEIYKAKGLDALKDFKT